MRILIKGAGDLATGIAYRLFMAGYELLMTDIQAPTTVRRTVAFSRAVTDKEAEVEGVKAVLVQNLEEAEKAAKEGKIPVIVDAKAEIKDSYHPQVIVDAIIAKKNLGTRITDAPLVIGVGPGFEAGKDCHSVIETKRGHTMGKVIKSGAAIPNTGVPGDVGGFTVERIIRAAADGEFVPVAAIGDKVEKGELVAYSGGQPVYAKMPGLVRGMLQSGLTVFKGMKCGDIDARCELFHCFTISDKAMAIGGGVLEEVVRFEHGKY